MALWRCFRLTKLQELAASAGALPLPPALAGLGAWGRGDPTSRRRRAGQTHSVCGGEINIKETRYLIEIFFSGFIINRERRKIE